MLFTGEGLVRFLQEPPHKGDPRMEPSLFCQHYYVNIEDMSELYRYKVMRPVFQF